MYTDKLWVTFVNTREQAHEEARKRTPLATKNSGSRRKKVKV